jgi:chemotaxis signal transduction protein
MTDDHEKVDDPATVIGHAFDWGHEEDSEFEGTEPDVIRFQLGNQAFATEAVHVSEVDRPPVLTPVPGLPPHVAGVAVRRRQVLSVLDLSNFFGLAPSSGEDQRLLVFEADGLEAGAIVDSILGLEVWPEDEESPGLDDIDERIRPFVDASRWAPGGRVLLLNVPDLLREASVR